MLGPGQIDLGRQAELAGPLQPGHIGHHLLDAIALLLDLLLEALDARILFVERNDDQAMENVRPDQEDHGQHDDQGDHAFAGVHGAPPLKSSPMSAPRLRPPLAASPLSGMRSLYSPAGRLSMSTLVVN